MAEAVVSWSRLRSRIVTDSLVVAQEVPREPTEIRLRWRSTGGVGVTRHPEHRPREAEMAEAVVSCSG